MVFCAGRNLSHKLADPRWRLTRNKGFDLAQVVYKLRGFASLQVSMETGHRLEWSSEENFLFKLTAFREKLLDWVNTKPYRKPNCSWIKSLFPFPFTMLIQYATFRLICSCATILPFIFPPPQLSFQRMPDCRCTTG